MASRLFELLIEQKEQEIARKRYSEGADIFGSKLEKVFEKAGEDPVRPRDVLEIIFSKEMAPYPAAQEAGLKAAQMMTTTFGYRQTAGKKGTVDLKWWNKKTGKSFQLKGVEKEGTQHQFVQDLVNAENSPYTWDLPKDIKKNLVTHDFLEIASGRWHKATVKKGSDEEKALFAKVEQPEGPFRWKEKDVGPEQLAMTRTKFWNTITNQLFGVGSLMQTLDPTQRALYQAVQEKGHKEWKASDFKKDPYEVRQKVYNQEAIKQLAKKFYSKRNFNFKDVKAQIENYLTRGIPLNQYIVEKLMKAKGWSKKDIQRMMTQVEIPVSTDEEFTFKKPSNVQGLVNRALGRTEKLGGI